MVTINIQMSFRYDSNYPPSIPLHSSLRTPASLRPHPFPNTSVCWLSYHATEYLSINSASVAHIHPAPYILKWNITITMSIYTVPLDSLSSLTFLIMWDTYQDETSHKCTTTRWCAVYHFHILATNVKVAFNVKCQIMPNTRVGYRKPNLYCTIVWFVAIHISFSMQYCRNPIMHCLIQIFLPK